MGRDISQLKPLSLTHPLICNTLSLLTQEQARTLEAREWRIGGRIEDDEGEEEGKHQQQPMDTLHSSTPSW
jgi:hypothetical protein